MNAATLFATMMLLSKLLDVEVHAQDSPNYYRTPSSVGNVRPNRNRKTPAAKVQRNAPAWHSTAEMGSTAPDTGDYCDLQITCRGNKYNSTRIPITLPIQGPPGPAGPKGEKGEKGDPGEAGVAGKPGRNATASKKIAFMAGLTHNIGNVEDDTDVIFDNVVTNVGDGYNRTTGRFTAGADGVYEFTVNIAAQGKNKAAVKLMHDNSMIFTVWSESLPLWGTASNTAILSVRKGDKVWLQTISRFSFLHGFMYSTFSGHLLFEND